MLKKFRCNPVLPLNGALPSWSLCVCVGYTWCSGRTLVHFCTASLQNLAVHQCFYSLLVVLLERPCYPLIRRCGTGGFREQGHCFFIGLSCSIPTIVFYLISISLLSVYRLVLCGWGLRTDRVYVTLSQPCTADLFLNNNNNNIRSIITIILLLSPVNQRWPL